MGMLCQTPSSHDMPEQKQERMLASLQFNRVAVAKYMSGLCRWTRGTQNVDPRPL